MKYKISLTTKSYLLVSSGEGSALIDADVVYHKSGFPYIPARRVKGLLRESMQEILEISGYDDDFINLKLDIFFGREGNKTTSGLLKIKNLYLPQWESIKSELLKYKRNYAFQPENIRKHYTSEIAQTTIVDDGVAKDNSLRNYRLLKPGLTFEGALELNVEKLSVDDQKLLDLSIANLRYAGTRRNRGFGKVKCTLDAREDNHAKGIDSDIKIKDFDEIKVVLKTNSPVVIALQYGEQNTVATDRIIQGNQLRGMLAWNYINTNGVNDDFLDMFLSENIHFHNLSLDGSRPLPLNIHTFKGFQDKPYINVFEKEQLEDGNDRDLITSSIGGYALIQAGTLKEMKPRTSFFFHNTRKKDRIAGRSTKDDDGGIFYYEALDEDQVFEGEITGDKQYLQMLLNYFPQCSSFSLGKSRSAQYGDVELQLIPVKKPENIKIKSCIFQLVLNSHLVLMNNENLFPRPDVTELKKQLKLLLDNNEDFEIIHGAATHTTIEQYNAAWQSKSGKIPAYKEGGTFVIQFKNEVELPDELQLGEYTEQGFGVISVSVYNEEKQVNYIKSGPPAGDATDEPYNCTNRQLNNIYESYTEAKKQTKAKTDAIKDAYKYKKLLTGHLISRLEMMIQEKDAEGGNDEQKFENVNKWFDKIKLKPAGEKLKKAGIMDDDGHVEFKKGIGFNDSKLYWITLLQTLRKLNKYE